MARVWLADCNTLQVSASGDAGRSRITNSLETGRAGNARSESTTENTLLEPCTPKNILPKKPPLVVPTASAATFQSTTACTLDSGRDTRAWYRVFQ